MNILIKGYYGFGNLGDDILMLSSFYLLKSQFPQAVITIFSNNSLNNKDAKTLAGYNHYIKKILKEEVEIIDWTHKGHFDLIFHGGGGVYFDNKSQGRNYINKILNYIPLYWVTALDTVLRTLVNKSKKLSCSRRIGVGIGIGSYGKGSKLLFNHLSEMGSYDQLVVRDESSFDFLANHHMIKGKYNINTDLAFINSWNNWSWRKRNSIKSVGIVVKDNLEDTLISSLIQLYQKLIERNISVTFYSFDENYDIHSPEIFRKFNFIQYKPLDLYNFLDNLYDEDIIFTTRAHGAILGACLGVPSVILNIEIKLNEVSTMLKRYCIRIDSWDIKNLISAFENFDINYTNILNNLLLDFRDNHNLTKELNELIQY